MVAYESRMVLKMESPTELSSIYGTNPDTCFSYRKMGRVKVVVFTQQKALS